VNHPAATSPASKSARLAVFLIAFVVFLATRYYILFHMPYAERASDVPTYADKAFTYDYAAKEGKSYYTYHAERIQGQIEAARRRGVPGPQEWNKIIEYPPTAVFWIALPQYLNDPLPTPTEMQSMSPRAYWSRIAELKLSYEEIFKRITAIPDVLAFLVCATIVFFVFRDDSLLIQAGRLMIYIVLGATLCQMIYVRLDILCGLLIVGAVALMVFRVPFFWSFIVLALAINFKLVPVVLVPLWLLGSLRADRMPSSWRASALHTTGLVLSGRLVLILGLVAMWAAPFVLTQGWECLDFLTYQKDRGIHIGSMFASILLMLRPLGHESHILFDHESFGLESSLTGAFGAASPFLMFFAVLGVTLLFALHCGGNSRSGNEPDIEPSRGPKPAARGETLAQRCPDAFIMTAVIALMVTLCGSKLFSSQFLLWFVPLVPLVRLKGAAGWIFPIGLAGVCVLTTLMFPFYFKSDILAITGPPTTFEGPTTFGAALIVSKNLLFLSLAGLAAWSLMRGHRATCGNKP
jgi:hypothetical protein